VRRQLAAAQVLCEQMKKQPRRWPLAQRNALFEGVSELARPLQSTFV